MTGAAKHPDSGAQLSDPCVSGDGTKGSAVAALGSFPVPYTAIEHDDDCNGKWPCSCIGADDVDFDEIWEARLGDEH